MPYCFESHYDEIACIGENEDKEKLLVAIAQTVVDKWTVVVVLFNALVANGAVLGRFRLDDSIVGAEVVQVKTVLECLLH